MAPVAAAAALAGTSVPRAASSTDRLAAGTSAPTARVCSSTASATLGDGGGGLHLSGGAPRRSPLPPPTMTNSLGSAGERAPAARSAGTPHSLAPGAPTAGSSSPSCALPAPVPITAWRGQPPGLGPWAGQTTRRSLSPSAKETTIKIAPVHHKRAREGGRPTHCRGVGEHNK
jgi:hypothetical protein